MRLLSSVLGFVLKKLGLFVALVLSLFLGYLLVQVLVPNVREAIADRDRLQQVAEERAALEADLAQLRKTAEEEQSKAIASLEAKKLLKGRFDLLKILGDGDLTKSLKVTAHRFSGSALEKIQQAGGEAITLPGKKPVVKNKQGKKR